MNLKKLEAEVALKESQGSLHRLKTAIAEGKYLPAEQATEELAEFMTAFQKFAMTIPARMAGAMSGYADAITIRNAQKAIRKELETMLTAYVDAMQVEDTPGGGAVRKYRVKPYKVPRWMVPAIEILRPRERVSVSVWAERNRVLPSGNAIPGPWRNSVTPYLVEIMDAFSDDTTEKIIFVKPTQVGGHLPPWRTHWGA